jgi:cyclopropane fatty-acyl-phospholipid synthase-like methyltransferase
MTKDERLVCHRFPRSSKYHPDWVIASASSGANALWLTEWLEEALALRPDMRVLDLGCGLAMSSIFLRREFGVQVPGPPTAANRMLVLKETQWGSPISQANGL